MVAFISTSFFTLIINIFIFPCPNPKVEDNYNYFVDRLTQINSPDCPYNKKLSCLWLKEDITTSILYLFIPFAKCMILLAAHVRVRECACLFLCVLTLFRLKGFIHLQLCLGHTWRVYIINLVLWVLIWMVLPSSFICVSKNVIFHLQRRNSSTLTNWRENSMIYWQPAKRWYILT